MQTVTIKQQIDRELKVLPPELQQKVLDYINHISSPGIPRGIAGKNLLKFAGTLSDAEADELTEIIEEGCEGIDSDEW